MEALKDYNKAIESYPNNTFTIEYKEMMKKIESEKSAKRNKNLNNPILRAWFNNPIFRAWFKKNFFLNSNLTLLTEWFMVGFFFGSIRDLSFYSALTKFFPLLGYLQTRRRR